MGHISNAIGLRLGINKSWFDKGPFSSSKAELVALVSKMFHKIFGSRWVQKQGIIFSQTLVAKGIVSKVLLIMFMYDAKPEDSSLFLYRALRRKRFLLRRKYRSAFKRYHRKYLKRSNSWRTLFRYSKHKKMYSYCKADRNAIRGVRITRIFTYSKIRSPFFFCFL